MADPNQPQPQPQPQPYQIPPGFQPPPPQRSGLPGWAIALIVGGVLLFVLCIVGAIVSIGVLTLLGSRVSQVFSTINSDLEPLPVPASPIPADTSSALAVGEAANLPELRISVTDARPITDLRGARPPTAGSQYYAVDVTFENTSERAVTLSVFSSSMQDEQGQEYGYSTVAQRASPDPGLPVVVTIQPGKSASGILFYMVPERARDLFWVYKDVAGGGQAVFAIKQESR